MKWRKWIQHEFPNDRKIYNYRPLFLTNPKTGYPLELDIFLIDLNIAIEVNGYQHYEVVSQFHPNGKKDLDYQKYKDGLKKYLCSKHKVTLISIAPWDKKYEKIEEIRICIEMIK